MTLRGIIRSQRDECHRAHLYKESKTVRPVGAGSRTVVARGRGTGGVAGCSSNAPGFGRAGRVSPRGLLTAQGCGQRSARCAQERAHWVAVTLSAPAANNNHGEEEGREEREKTIKQVLYKYEARSSPRRPCT